jgi:hypothetical protein
MTPQQYDKLWTERESFRRLSESLQTELLEANNEKEVLKNTVQVLANILAAQGVKSFGN